MSEINYIVADKKVVIGGLFEDIKPTADARFKTGDGFNMYHKSGSSYYYKGCHWKSSMDEDGEMSGRHVHPYKLVEDEDMIAMFKAYDKQLG